MSRIAIDTQWVKINYEWVFLFSCTCIFTGFLIIFSWDIFCFINISLNARAKQFISNPLCDLWSTLGENEAIVQTRLGVVYYTMGKNFFWRSILIFMHFCETCFQFFQYTSFLFCSYVQSINPSKVLSVKIDMT